MFRLNARKLRQCAGADKVFWVQIRNPVDHVIGQLRPFHTGFSRTQVMPHSNRAWREDSLIYATLPLQFQLVVLDTIANIIITNFKQRPGQLEVTIFNQFELVFAPLAHFFRLSCVVTVAIDDHNIAFPF